LESGEGSLAFSVFFAFAAAAGEFAAVVVDGAFEDTVVVGAGDGGDMVLRSGGGGGLKEFLEFTLGVFEDGDGVYLGKGSAEMGGNEFFGVGKATVQENRAEDGFEGVGQGGGTVAAAVDLFAVTEDKELAEMEVAAFFGEGTAVDEFGAGFGELAFADVREFFVELAAEDELKNGVAKEFKALVVLHGHTLLVGDGGMGKGQAQKGGVAELMAEGGLEFGERARRLGGGRVRLGRVRRRHFAELSRLGRRGGRVRDGRNRVGRRVQAVLEQFRDVALDLFELVELEVGVNDGENIAGLGMFVNKEAAAFARELFLDLEEAFALEHDGEDVAGGDVAWIVKGDEFAQKGFGGVLGDGVGRGHGCLEDALPVGNEAFAVAGTLAVLGLPARSAHIGTAEVVFFVKEEGVIGFLIGEGMAAGFASAAAGLDVPLVHRMGIEICIATII
jgi:hypothetical protein